MLENRYIRILVKCLALLFAIGIVSGVIYFLYTLVVSDWVPNTPADITYAVKTTNGSMWYEIVSGRIYSHPELQGSTITGIARGGDVTFILSTSGSSSTLFSYNPKTKAYAKVYSAPQLLNGLAIDPNGLYAAFTMNDPVSTTPDVEVLTLSTGKVKQIGYGYSPVFLGSTQVKNTVNGKSFASNDGYMNILFAHGPAIEDVTLYKTTVSSSTIVSLSSKAFASNAQLVSNGETSFGFIDPVSFAGSVWQASVLAPFVASPKSSYQNIPGSVLGFTNGSLTRLVLSQAPQGSKGSTVTTAHITIFGDPSKQGSTASVEIPLKAAGSGQLLFVGLISS